MTGTEQLQRELTFGEKAVGLTFNPGGNGAVNDIKRKSADYIDLLNELRNSVDNPEQKRQLSIAITEAQTSQMWAVKGVTWQY
jgi:GH18 family chitinase